MAKGKKKKSGKNGRGGGASGGGGGAGGATGEFISNLAGNVVGQFLADRADQWLDKSKGDASAEGDATFRLLRLLAGRRSVPLHELVAAGGVGLGVALGALRTARAFGLVKFDRRAKTLRLTRAGRQTVEAIRQEIRRGEENKERGPSDVKSGSDGKKDGERTKSRSQNQNGSKDGDADDSTHDSHEKLERAS